MNAVVTPWAESLPERVLHRTVPESAGRIGNGRVVPYLEGLSLTAVRRVGVEQVLDPHCERPVFQAGVRAVQTPDAP